VAKWIDPNFSLLEVLVANSMWRSRLKNLWRILCESFSWSENLKRYAREAGIGKIHLHQTRHTFARMVAKRSGSLSETQDALGHRHASTTRIYVESIAVKTDKYSQHILEALELPDFEIDFSSDSGADQETNGKAAV